MTLIAQITDCHIGFDRDDPEEENVRRLRGVLDRLVHGPNRPDLLLLTGDLTGHGEAGNYARLAEQLAGLPFPVRLMAGNWDRREPLCAAFPETETHDGFIQYEVPLPGLRLIALDTTQPGRHGGAFCADRAAWLSARLDADPVTPVLIAMHHPPVETGIQWNDSGAHEAWIARFAAAIEGREQVRAIIAGHMHRTIHTTFCGAPLIICGASAPEVTLDLSPIDPDRPDGRAMVAADPAIYALHRWTGVRLISHFDAVPVGGSWDVLARFDAGMAETVRHNAREREE